jgi:hypothetical protein
MAGHGHGDHSGGDKRIALLISVLALFLAVAETGAKSAQTDAISSNVQAANLWAFFQARSIRQTTVRTAAEAAELEKLNAADAAARATIERQQQGWRDSAQRWESEPQTGEGRRELMSRAQAAEHRRDRSMAAYHHYEYGSAAFQVAIVLASSSIVTGVPLLALGGVAVGVVGVALTGIGFLFPEAVHF